MGETDPVKRQMDEFMEAEVVFEKMAALEGSMTGYQEQTQMDVTGLTACVTVRRTCKLKNGKE